MAQAADAARPGQLQRQHRRGHPVHPADAALPHGGLRPLRWAVPPVRAGIAGAVTEAPEAPVARRPAAADRRVAPPPQRTRTATRPGPGAPRMLEVDVERRVPGFSLTAWLPGPGTPGVIALFGRSGERQDHPRQPHRRPTRPLPDAGPRSRLDTRRCSPTPHAGIERCPRSSGVAWATCSRRRACSRT